MRWPPDTNGTGTQKVAGEAGLRWGASGRDTR